MSADEGKTRGNAEVEETDGFTYNVLSVDQIVEIQRDIIDEVSDILELSPQVSRTILNHFKWDKDPLFLKYFESSPKEFFKSVPVLNPFEEQSAINPSLGNTACEICYSSDQKLDGLGCGHIYCVGCWKMYLANKTCSEGLSHSITCPAPNCDILVDYVTFHQFADNTQVVERYKHLITNFFVECNALMRWCPNCTHAIEANSVEPKAVKCKCGHQFCFVCSEDWHEPIACSWLKKWLKITATDEPSIESDSELIDETTKRCPQCGVAVQKDGGCNHVVCMDRCSYEFCWLCLGKWHGSGNCYINAEVLSEEMIARYQRYKDRYIHHTESLKKEHKFYAKVLAKGDDNQAEISWIEVPYLRDAIDALCKSRTNLMYSDVFAFYLQENSQKKTFESNKWYLEMFTERISECLEQGAENLDDKKKRLIELTHYCQRRRRILLNHVREGNEKQWWDLIKVPTLLSL